MMHRIRTKHILAAAAAVVTVAGAPFVGSVKMSSVPIRIVPITDTVEYLPLVFPYPPLQS